MALSDIYIQDIQRTISLINIPNRNNAYFPVAAITDSTQPSTFISGKMSLSDLIIGSTIDAVSKITPDFMLNNIFDFGGNIVATIVNDKIQLNYNGAPVSGKRTTNPEIIEEINNLKKEISEIKRLMV